MSIIAENLSYVYSKGTPFEKTALNSVSLKIDDGEFVGIIGHTGCGKSTLVQHFNGILKPTSGKILINGTDTAQKNLKELRRHVGIVFQYPEHQLFEETVLKDISFGLNKSGMNEDQVRVRVEEVMKIVGLKNDLLDKSPFELSGGQKRRTAIAGVLIMNPQILVLDEPTAGLDPKGRDEIFEFIKQAHKTLGITIILVSHSMEDIARLVSRVVVMNRGGIEMDGTVSEIFQNSERLENIGLSAPQISYLMKKLNSAAPEISGDVFTVKDAGDAIIKHLRQTGKINV